jgi:hypothetical protein
LAGAAADAAGSQAAVTETSPDFTLSSLTDTWWLRAGEKTQVAIASAQLHVLPAIHGEAPWDTPILGLEGLLTGLNQAMTAGVVLRNESGTALVKTDTDLRLGSESVVSTVTAPQLSVREILALLPPGLVPSGVKVEGEADGQLHAQVQLPLTKEVTADWEVRVASGRLTLPASPKPIEFPDTRFEGKASLKGSALKTTVRLTGGGSAPWAEILLDVAVDLDSLKGSFAVKSPGTDLARLAALMPQLEVSFPAALPLKFEAGADFDWPNRAAENLRLRLDLAAGHVTVGGRPLDWSAVGATVTGRASAGFPESAASIGVSVKAAFPLGTVAADSSAVWDGKSGRLRVQSQSTPFDAGLLLGIVPGMPAGTAVALPVSWLLEADLDTRSGLVRQAKAVLDLGAGSLTVPEFLSAPLTMAPWRFAAEITEQGATGKIAPFDWTVGPLKIHSDGGGWARTGERLEGRFSLGVGRVKVADCVALLSRKLQAQLPKELAEVGDLALAGLDWREHITGVWKDDQPVFDRTVADGQLDLALGPEPLSVLAHLEMPVPPKTIHAEITIPNFVQARWRLPLLDHLPVPWLDAPAKAQFTVDWEFPALLKSAHWRVETGAGRILPRGLLAEWLGEPFPLTRFVVGGSVGPDFSRFEIDEFLLESGRARCRFDRFAVDIKPEADRRRLRMGGRLVLENWFAEDFIPLLKRPVRDGLPGEGTALLDLGLQTFTASLDAAIAVEPSGKVVIESMKHDGSCVLRVGDQPLPLTTAAGYDPVTHQVFVRTEIADLRPAQFRPQLARGLVVAPSVFDFPLSLRLEARSTVPPDFPQTQPLLPEVGLTVRGGPGTIHRCEFLAVDTPLRSLELEANVSVGDQTLKSFRARADFGGPVISVDSLRASFGEALTAEVKANLADLPLDWLLERVPPDLLAPDARAFLPKLAIGGVVRSLRVAGEARLPAGKAAKPELVALRIDGEVEKSAVHLEDRPALTIGHVQIAGDAQMIQVSATDILAGPLQVPRLEITASQILGTKPAVAGRLTASTHLAELPAFLRSLSASVVLPEAFDWSKLDGNLTAEVTGAAELARLPDLAAVSAEMKVSVDGLTMPAIPGRFETAPGSGEASLRFKNSVADLEGSLVANLKRGFEVVEGPVRAKFAAHGELAGRAEATVGVDFKDASLHAPGGLAWEKAPGAAASLQARLATADYGSAGKAVSATFELTGKGLVYGQLALKGRVDAKSASEGTPAAVKLVCDSIVADDTSLRFEADAVWPRSLDARLSGSRLDLRPLVRLAAPQFAAWNAPSSPAPASAGVAVAKPVAAGVIAPAAGPGAVLSPTSAVSASASPISPGAAEATASFFPAESNVQVTLQEVVLGGGRTLAPFVFTTRLRGAQPVSGELSFESSNHGVSASLQPGPDRPIWSAKIDDVADFLAVGASPLRELPATMTGADTTIGWLIDLPDRFGGGRLTADGPLVLENAANPVQGRLQIADLRLRSEIPFLSSIAKLVHKPVRFTIPFKEFRIDSFTLGWDDLHLQNAFLNGPIALTAEKFDLDFVKWELFLRGKVFGIWFEVTGPTGHLEYYLADKNPGLKLLTTEDEFQW